MKDEYDFSTATPARDVAHLNKLRASVSNKTRITIMLDNDVIDGFKQRAASHGVGYQTEINSVLKLMLNQDSLEDTLRRVVREELDRGQ